MSQQQQQRASGATPSWRRETRSPHQVARQEERQMRGAQVAYDELAAQVQSWASPMVSANEQQQQQQHHAAESSSSHRYEQDAVAWMKQAIQEPDDPYADNAADSEGDEDITMMPGDDDEEHATTTTPPIPQTPGKRTLERADTPVMSNARRVRRPNSNTVVDTPMIPHNVQSPVYLGQGDEVDDDMAAAAAPDAAGAMPDYQETPLSRIYIQQCTSYHDALVHYVKSKRRLVERMELLRREQALIVSQSSSSQPFHSAVGAVVVDKKLLDEEHHIEADLLRTLSSLAFDRASLSTSSSSFTTDNSMQNPCRKEGNFWLLLARLRELGMETLLWDNDPDTERRNLHALNMFKESLAARFDATPLELVQALSSYSKDQQQQQPGGPLILRRRYLILQWLHDCFRRVLPAGATRPRTSNHILSQSELLSTQGLYETDQDAEILRLCLALVLAGRLEDAKRLVRESGLAWRAALWSGGAPHGYQVVNRSNNQENQAATTTLSERGRPSGVTSKVAGGNTRRPLWKVLIWKQSESLAKDPKASKEEAAIASILSSNLKKSLENACLRSWEKGLFVSMHAVLSRLEDEVLHAHNNHRRRRQQMMIQSGPSSPPYPGTEFENKERDHLVATSNVAPLTEAGIFQMLDSSPFEEMRNDDPITVATAAFLVGKSAVLALMETSFALLEKGDESTLRFMAHLALYLDSLSACSTPLNMPEISAWKNNMVLQWVDHLASREELWKLVVLYVSLLPENDIIETLPVLLSNIESQQQRSVIVAQMQEFLPNPNLDRIVLQEVVRLVLLEQDDVMISSGHYDDEDDAPSYTDDRKMRAILWMCQSKAHLGDALIFSNTLLRQFLLAPYKLKSAFRFIDDIRPQQVLDLANGTVAGEDDDDIDESMEDEEQYSTQVQQARWEHLAFQSYLDAEKEVIGWRDVLSSSDTSIVIEEGFDYSQLNATESAIAKSTERRKMTEIKRELSTTVVSAANEALEGLTRVLQHPGGWLFMEPEDMSGDEQEQNRYVELHRLRVKLLPDVAMRYLEVCSETAAWLSASLDDGVAQLHGKPDAVLLVLDNARDGVSSSPIAPIYWTRQALRLVDDITSETMTVEKACGVSDMKAILHKIADITVAHLKYSSYLGQSPDF